MVVASDDIEEIAYRSPGFTAWQTESWFNPAVTVRRFSARWALLT
jgi:uncharacterized protein CbrC (UPF0167 family)